MYTMIFMCKIFLLASINILLPVSGSPKVGINANTSLELDFGCLSWRFAVEANNLGGWHTVPTQCLLYVENYMLGGQYNKDLNMVVQQALTYVNSLPPPSEDGMDSFILDVDETCLSNIQYYWNKRFGGDPYDPVQFRNWAQRGACLAIPATLGLYRKLVRDGFKVFLLSGRDEELLGSATAANLYMQGFVGHERLILRSPEYRGQSSATYKSTIRKQLVEEGYQIVGNIGDQWSDLLGDCNGNRIFKLPNPMYFVP